MGTDTSIERSDLALARLIATRRDLLALVPGGALVIGLVLLGLGYASLASGFFIVATLIVLAVLVRQIVTSLAAGEVGLDVIAALAMAAALVSGEWLAGAVVALMYAGGQALEARAQARAEQEMTALLSRVPQRARRLDGDRVIDVAIETVAPGDRLLIAPGEIVPVDGIVVEGAAVLDEAALTGESVPVTHTAGSAVESGTQNAGPAFRLEATAAAADSALARIVALVDAARRSKAPMSRLADRYAIGFLAVTLILAGSAWAATGDFTRALAVLVIATPCPLILAVPVAMVAGMSRAAGRGILIKSAAALEGLAAARTVLLDKTGTLTRGSADFAAFETVSGDSADRILALGASLAQGSRHVMSEALVKEARARGHALAAPHRVVETAGAGIVGEVGDVRVAVGRPSFVAGHCRDGADGPLAGQLSRDGAAELAIGIDGRFAAIVTLADPLRQEAAAALRHLRSTGVARIVLVSGDSAHVTERIAGQLPLDAAHADVSPEGKVAIVTRESEGGHTVMVGDGINDAAALAAATVGVAMGARGSAAAAEAADVVLLVDRLDRVPEAIRIAQDTRAIAVQSVAVGMALSIVGMLVAAAGYLPPLAGALAQEAIDVAVVLNALRALGRWPRASDQSVPG